jgi:hypothetical protein
MEPDKPAADSPAELKARALRHLVRREHSRAELARKLARHAESPQALEAVLDSLLAKKQQSDERFAEERVRSLSRKYGSAKIRQDLEFRTNWLIAFPTKASWKGRKPFFSANTGSLRLRAKRARSARASFKAAASPTM